MQAKNNTSTNQQVVLNSIKAKIDDRPIRPKVSVMIVSYNQKNFVAEAIEGAINQDYENLEVVISDDGSTDGTADIIAQWQLRYPERLVALLNRENVGITRNSNRCLRACTGDFIAFLGGDDVLLPGKISAQVDWFEKDEKRVLCGHQVEVFYENTSKAPHQLGKLMIAGEGPALIIRNGGCYGACSIMVTKWAIPKDGFNEKLPNVSDTMFWIDTVFPNHKWGFIEGVYAKYRKHSHNVTNNIELTRSEVTLALDIVKQKYPAYQQDCRIAEGVNKYEIGKFYLMQFDSKKANYFFWQSILTDPLNFKYWVRYFQGWLLVIRKRLKKVKGI